MTSVRRRCPPPPADAPEIPGAGVTGRPNVCVFPSRFAVAEAPAPPVRASSLCGCSNTRRYHRASNRACRPRGRGHRPRPPGRLSVRVGRCPAMPSDGCAVFAGACETGAASLQAIDRAGEALMHAEAPATSGRGRSAREVGSSLDCFRCNCMEFAGCGSRCNKCDNSLSKLSCKNTLICSNCKSQISWPSVRRRERCPVGSRRQHR